MYKFWSNAGGAMTRVRAPLGACPPKGDPRSPGPCHRWRRSLWRTFCTPGGLRIREFFSALSSRRHYRTGPPFSRSRRPPPRKALAGINTFFLIYYESYITVTFLLILCWKFACLHIAGLITEQNWNFARFSFVYVRRMIRSGPSRQPSEGKSSGREECAWCCSHPRRPPPFTQVVGGSWWEKRLPAGSPASKEKEAFRYPSQEYISKLEIINLHKWSVDGEWHFYNGLGQCAQTFFSSLPFLSVNYKDGSTCQVKNERRWTAATERNPPGNNGPFGSRASRGKVRCFYRASSTRSLLSKTAPSVSLRFHCDW